MTTTRPGPEIDTSDRPPANDWRSIADEVAAAAAPFEAGHDTAGTFVAEAFADIRSTGLAAAGIPSELGGGGLTHRATGDVLTRLAHGSPSAAVALSMHCQSVAGLIWRYRTDGSTADVLRRIAAERLIVVTSGAGDWIGSSGTARRVDGGFAVTAEKRPVSGAPAGDLFLTSVRLEDTAPQVVHFTVALGTPGVTVVRSWDALGLRGSGSDTVVMDEVVVPDEAVSLVRPADEWHPVWSVIVGAAAPLIMAAYLGVAQAAAMAALPAAARRTDGAPLVGDMENQLAAADDAVARMFEMSADLTFEPTTAHAAAMLSRKTNAATAVRTVVDRAVEIVGGAAYTKPHLLERLSRDIRGAAFHPLPPARQRTFTGRVALGLDPVSRTPRERAG